MTGIRTVNFCGVPGVPAQFRINGGGIPETTVIANAAGQAAFVLPTQHDPNHPNQTAVNVFYEAIGQHDIGAPGYLWYGQVQYIQDGNVDAWIVDYRALGYQPPYPAQWQQLTPLVQSSMIPVPNREQLCTAKQTFQGLTVFSQQYGALPLFDPVALWFTGPNADADCAAVCQAHTSVGDQILTISLSGQYNEAGQAYQNIPGADFSNNLSDLSARLLSIVRRGLYIDLRLAGDGTAPDPAGMTYGHDWLMANFERIANGLAAVEPYIRWCPAYDAWWYGWSAQQVKDFGTLFRNVMGQQAVLCGEFGINGPHLGNGEKDYQPGGGLYDYDLFQLELDAGNAGGHNDDLWQPGARMIGPAYVRPPDQPHGDDPSPPFYLIGGTDRGPFHAQAFEDWLYYQVRNQCTIQQITDYRDYKRGVGFVLVG